MTLDRWRGTSGLLGWLTYKWDLWRIRRQLQQWRRERRDGRPL